MIHYHQASAGKMELFVAKLKLNPQIDMYIVHVKVDLDFDLGYPIYNRIIMIFTQQQKAYY